MLSEMNLCPEDALRQFMNLTNLDIAIRAKTDLSTTDDGSFTKAKLACR